MSQGAPIPLPSFALSVPSFGFLSNVQMTQQGIGFCKKLKLSIFTYRCKQRVKQHFFWKKMIFFANSFLCNANHFSSDFLSHFLLSFSPRESFRTFRELSEIFSDDNNYSLSRELLVKVGFSHPHEKKFRLDKEKAVPWFRWLHPHIHGLNIPGISK